MLLASVTLVITKLLLKEANKMNEDYRQKRSITSFSRLIGIFPVVFFILQTAGLSAFIIAYVTTENTLFSILAIIYGLLMAAIYIIFTVLTTKKFDALFVRGLYNTTLFNFRNITDNGNALIDYPNHSYQEFVALNQQVDSLKTELDNSTLISNSTDYSHINLDYADVENNVVYLRSFKMNLESIIFASQNYRNLLVELSYELNDDVLTDKETEYLLALMRKFFGNYQNVLYIINENKKSLLFYFPRIDSLSKIREQLEIVIRNATITKRTVDGMASLMAHFSIVCYPFSDVKELLPDLEYAKRQGEIINVYLPNRLTTLTDNKILKNSMNLNTMSKILAPLHNLNLSLENSSKNLQEVEKVIKAIRSYFSLDYGGIISFDEERNLYRFTYQNQDKDVPPLTNSPYIEKEFVYAMNAAKDEDGSYYFSFRNNANSALGRHLDRVGLESGLFYMLNDGDNVVGAVYFFNRKKEFHIDSYIQEALVVLCDKIATILLGERRDEEVRNSMQEIDSLLKLSGYATYRISNNDYRLLRASNTMKDIFSNISLGEKCYKALYGLDKPCPDCPLLTGNKKTNEIKNHNYETSLVLSNRSSPYHVLTLKNLYKEEGTQRYNPDLLINSYGSLVEALNNCYEINGKGYLLLLRTDNISDLIESNGSEGYLAIIREFISQVKKKHNSLENIYYFNNQTLALLFTEYGQIDIIAECEKLFKISQAIVLGDSDSVKVKFTYLPIGYPHSYPNAQSVLKQAEQFANRGKYEINKNFIYFDDSNYSRSADRDAFLLSVIETSFTNKTFNVMFQPMCDARTKEIFGAELLLRITDGFTNIALRPDELALVAEAHNKIGLISNALLEIISGLYKQYGSSVFSNLRFQRLSLNTDYSFFTDENFYIDTKAYIDNAKLPRNFLAFEIPESDVANHVHEFKSISKQMRLFHIVLVCDQYTGRFISLDALKEIGFDEVKISRNIVNHIDSDRQRLNDIKTLLENIKTFGLKASIVGVENIDQYLLLKEIDGTALMQGYYLHRPLEKLALIDAIRSSNKAS